MSTHVKMPSLGMTMEEGRVVAWRVKEGDRIAQGQVLVDIESEKTAYEIESPADGVVEKIAVPDDTVVPVGATLCSIYASGEAASGPAARTEGEEREPEAAARRRKVSPRARRLAQELGVDVAKLAGGGPDNTILEEDILAAAGRSDVGRSDTASKPAASPDSGFTLHPLTSMRRVTAERMTESARSAPHFYLAVEMDGSALLQQRAEHGTRLEAETGIKLTLTDLMAMIVARTLTHHRALNATYTPEGIREWQAVDLGIAVALEQGLIVPVIRAAERKSLPALMRSRADLVARARAGKLTQADVELGTFTLSNLGILGVDFFTSILNPPQAAILSVGSLAERATVVAGALTVRPTMMVGLTIDHRVTDGAAGARFLADLRERIEAGAIEVP